MYVSRQAIEIADLNLQVTLEHLYGLDGVYTVYTDIPRSGVQPMCPVVRQVLDSNGSGGLTSQEFCAAMKKLVQ